MERRTQTKRHGERGAAMAMVLMAMAVLLVLITAGLQASAKSLQTTHNYRFATQALFVAESAMLDAVKTINGPGVVDMQSEVIESWATVFGQGSRTFAGATGFAYAVRPVATAWEAADPGDRGTLLATAMGPQGTTTAVVARLTRSDIPSTSPGAVYLANDSPTDATFTGDAFWIDGNDRNYSGGAGTGDAVPGISTRNAANATETLSSLNSDQQNNVQGLGYNPGPPITPSVETSPVAPTQSQLDQIIDALLDRPHAVCPDNQINSSSTCTYGTEEAPQITYFSNGGGVRVRGNGNITGAGILIVEGGLIIQGTLDFKGLIIVRGPTTIDYDSTTTTTGNATLYGALWTTDLGFQVGGSAILQYSTQGLALANQSGGGGSLPAPVNIAMLADCSVLPVGTNGCP